RPRGRGGHPACERFGGCTGSAPGARGARGGAPGGVARPGGGRPPGGAAGTRPGPPGPARAGGARRALPPLPPSGPPSPLGPRRDVRRTRVAPRLWRRSGRARSRRFADKPRRHAPARAADRCAMSERISWLSAASGRHGRLSARRRLLRLTGAQAPRRAWTAGVVAGRRPVVMIVAGTALAGALAGALGGVVAAVIAIWYAGLALRAARRAVVERSITANRTVVLDLISGLAADLRTGAAPAVAVEA